MNQRVPVRDILRDLRQRRDLMVRCIVATQAREGILTSTAQAEAAYDKVQKERTVLDRIERAMV